MRLEQQPVACNARSLFVLIWIEIIVGLVATPSRSSRTQPGLRTKFRKSKHRMKLALVGGGGVRAPLFVASALRRAERIGLEELCLMDIDAGKLAIFGELCREV